MGNILIYPRDRRVEPAPAPQTDTYHDPLMSLGWLIAAVGLLCMLSAIALASLNF